MTRGRSRDQISGGYARKTVSLPAEQVDRIEVYLKRVPGLTISSFLTVAADVELTKQGLPPKVKR